MSKIGIEAELAEVLECTRECLEAKDAHIAALEKCIEARDAWLLRLESRGIDDVIGCECHDCAEFKSAIRRADEEAGR